MQSEEINLKKLMLKKLDENNPMGLTMKDLKKRFPECDEKIRKTLTELENEGKISENLEKRKQDHKKNIVFRSIA